MVEATLIIAYIGIVAYVGFSLWLNAKTAKTTTKIPLITYIFWALFWPCTLFSIICMSLSKYLCNLRKTIPQNKCCECSGECCNSTLPESIAESNNDIVLLAEQADDLLDAVAEGECEDEEDLQWAEHIDEERSVEPKEDRTSSFADNQIAEPDSPQSRDYDSGSNSDSGGYDSSNSDDSGSDDSGSDD